MDNTSGLSEQLTYDGLGNLTQVKLLNGTTITSTIDYIVDGKGRRIGKKVNGTLKKQWIYDGQLRIVAELTTNGSTNTMTRFVYGSRTNTPELMLKYTSPGATPTAYRIFSDHLGSPRVVVNAANVNDVLLKVHYSAFGIPTLEGGSLDAVPMGFAGGLFDPDTALVRFGARDYDARFGRWVSKEPLRFVAGTNFYVYSHNDPVDYVDVDGRFPILVVGAIVAVAAAFGGYLDYLYIPTQEAMKSGLPGQWLGAGDAYRHCLASCMVSSQLGPDIANWLGDLRESFEKDTVCGEGDMDRLNNRTGSQLGQDVGFGDMNGCQLQCSNALWFGDLARME